MIKGMLLGWFVHIQGMLGGWKLRLEDKLVKGEVGHQGWKLGAWSA